MVLWRRAPWSFTIAVRDLASFSQTRGDGAFVHVSALARAEMPDLFEGQNVSFEVKVDKGTGKSFVLRIKLAHNA